MLGDYPEVFDAGRNYPSGRLNDYQEHRIRAWGIYQQPLGFLGDIDVALFYKYDSPLSYSLTASSVALSVDSAPARRCLRDAARRRRPCSSTSAAPSCSTPRICGTSA